MGSALGPPKEPATENAHVLDAKLMHSLLSGQHALDPEVVL